MLKYDNSYHTVSNVLCYIVMCLPAENLRKDSKFDANFITLYMFFETCFKSLSGIVIVFLYTL